MIRTVPPFRRAAVLLAITSIVFAIVVIGAAVLTSTAPVAAQTTNVSDVAPYYANESTAVNNESWYENTENATLDSMGAMATRFTSYFLGYGVMAPDNAGFEGILITGIVMTAMFIGAVAILPLGSVGGGVLAIIVGYGMTEMGLAPGWFRVVLLFVVGMLVYVAYRQSQQAR